MPLLLRPSLLAAVWVAALYAGETPVPAVFHITDQVVNPDPGAITATTGPSRILVDMPCEPMVWRTAFRVTTAGTGVIQAARLDSYDTFAAGYWDGSQARVLRARDGAISQVFDGEVRRYVRGEWSATGSGLVPAGTTSITYAIENWARHGIAWWFSIAAVDKAGRESPLSTAVSLIDPEVAGERGKPKEPAWTAAPQSNGKASGPPPAAPAGFTLSVDPQTTVMTATWQAVPGDIAGYRLYRTVTDPATHRGNFLELGPRGGGSTFQSKEGDIVLLTRSARSFSKDWYAPRVYAAAISRPPAYQPYFGNGERTPVPFELVPHPGALPADASDAGQTCLRFTAPAGDVTAIRLYNHSGLKQDWYRVLDPKETYVVEVLARHEGLATGRLRFRFSGPLDGKVAPIDFPIDGTWKTLRAEFTVPERLERGDAVGQMCLEVVGPGTLFLDNWRVYEKSDGLARWNAADRQAISESGISAIRTHDTIKSDGYSLTDLLGHPRTGLSSGLNLIGRANLAALLGEMRDLKIDPWIQIEFSMDEAEWDGLVEYLAASYDPAKDTPESRPWAWRRVSHGQAQPYTAAFRRILFEFGNENWNRIMPFHTGGLGMIDAADGRVYGAGEVYGMLQEYVIKRLKASRWWTPEMERKSEFVLGGWAMNAFGYDAARMSPSSRHVLVADYNGGWDASEGPSSDFAGALDKTLIFGAQFSRPNAIRQRQVRDAAVAGSDRHLAIGTYEAGPGYNLNGLNGVRMTPEMVEFENTVMKSLAAGTATLDCFLSQAEQGAQLQNFFTFSRNRNYWTSHAQTRNGGQAYPSWMALSLYNRFGGGDQLKVLTARTPVRTAAAIGRRPAMSDAPEVAVYATRSKDRLAVFAISRRLDGHVPLTLHLPITAAKAVRVHALTGDPRANNLDAENIRPTVTDLPPAVGVQEFVIDASRGADARGLPPATVLLYVFEGCTFAPAGVAALVNPAPGQADTSSGLPLRFHVGFTRPPAAFVTGDLVLTGSAEPQTCTISPTPGGYGMEFDVSVDQVMSEGEVRLALRDGFSLGGAAVKPAAAAVSLRLPAGAQLPLLAWNFAVDQQQDYAGRPVPATRRLPVVEVATLSASQPGLLGGNLYYNTDGAGMHAGRMDPAVMYAYSLPLVPTVGRSLDIARIEVGLWAGPGSEDEALTAELQVLRDGAVVASTAFVTAKPVRTSGLKPGIGIRAVANCSTLAVLQDLRQAVELRIVLHGLEKRGGIFGIGKMGNSVDDLVVLGRMGSR